MKRLILLAAVALLHALPAIGQKTVTIYLEDFDSVVGIEDLTGWEIGEGWRIDTATPSNGSGFQSLGVYGGPGDPAITPPIDLRRLTEGVFEYRARRTNTFYQNSIVVTASIDGGLTFPFLIADSTEALEGVGTPWRLMEFPLPEQLLGQEDVRFRIESFTGGAGSASARFDDIHVLGLARFDVEPPQGLFAAEPGDTDQQTFVLTNYGTQPLDVHAPELSASEFTIDPATSVTLLPEEEQVYTITFAPTVEGVVDAVLEIETDDAGGVSVPLIGLTTINQVAFSQESSAAGEAETGIPVDISLTFSNEDADLHGIELWLSWDDPILELTDILPGPAVSGNGWSVSFEVGDRSAKVLVFDDHGAGLTSYHYDPIVTLSFDAALLENGPREVELSIDHIIGALAVPTADDAGLFIRQPKHSLLIEKRYAFFSIDEEAINLGIIQAGETETTSFTIANPGGQRALGITGLTFSGGPYVVEPASAVIDPDESETFTITFAPTITDFGLADVTLDIEHNGELDGVHQLPVRGIGIFGRGDNDGDGMVDAMDIINTIDFILDRSEPSALQKSLSDLYPFADGDGLLDIRDLSVSVQAIVRGVWPDESPLPVSYDPEALDSGPSKRAIASDEITVAAIDEGEELVLTLETGVSLRALQIHLEVEHLESGPVLLLNTDGSPAASGRIEADVDSRLVRMLLYRPDGGTMPAGSYTFAVIRRSASGFVMKDYATAIGAEKQRQSVDIIGLVGSSVDDFEGPDRFTVDTFYPNPFSLSAATEVTVPVRVPGRSSIQVEVFNVLGRRVHTHDVGVEGRASLTWGGRDAAGVPVTPGLYLVRITAGDRHFVRQVVVVR